MKSQTPLQINDLLKTYKLDDKPWLIAGMGPSFSKYKDLDLSGYNILGINRVVMKIPVTFCSIIDYYILDIVKAYLCQADYLVMPYYPHFGCKPNPNLHLHSLGMYQEPLNTMIKEDKLLAYNLCTIPLCFGSSPTIMAQYFSAEAAFSMLAHLGAKKIYTLGIDGGHTRAEEFKEHGPTDPRGFDIQFRGIDNTCTQFNIERIAL